MLTQPVVVPLCPSNSTLVVVVALISQIRNWTWCQQDFDFHFNYHKCNNGQWNDTIFVTFYIVHNFAYWVGQQNSLLEIEMRATLISTSQCSPLIHFSSSLCCRTRYVFPREIVCIQALQGHLLPTFWSLSKRFVVPIKCTWLRVELAGFMNPFVGNWKYLYHCQ